MIATNIVADGIEPERRRRAYTAVSLATAMSVLDASIANMALPTIARELHVSAASIVWVVNAFNLAVTATLFAAAGYGSSLGMTRIYRVGVVAFTAGSLLCALSGSFPLLVAARVVQGIGAAMVVAIQPAMVRAIFPRAEMIRALGWSSLVVALTTAAAPTIGGLILAVLPWPWLFGLSVPFACIAIVLGAKTLPDPPGHHERIDLASVAASAAGFSLLVYGIDGFSRHDSLLAIACESLAGAVIFVWFVRRQFALARPIVALDLFRIPAFASAAGTSFAAWVGWGMGFVTLPFVLQLDRGYSPLIAGLLLTSWPLGTALSSPIAARATRRFSVRRLASSGLALTGCAFAGFAVFSHAAPVAVILLLGALAGIGFGCFQAPNNNELLGVGPLEKSTSAGALLAVLRVSGQTLGGSIVALVFAWAERSGTAHFVERSAPIALGIAAAFAALATAISVRRTR
jgi:DHA2 family multidrug resistance protein-like MFS transporter